jgi:opacity protein-like surface antigen
MTSRIMFLVAGLLAWAGAGLQPAEAEPVRPGGYAGLLVMGSNGTVGHSMLADTDFNGFQQPGTTQRTDDVAGIGVQGGWRLRDLPFRFELEAHYRVRFDNNAFDALDSGTGRTAVYHSNISTIALLASAVYEWRNTSSFTPFIGVTAGWARHRAESTKFDVGGIVPDQELKATTDNFAVGALAGVEWTFAERWSAAFTYRVMDLGETESGRFAGGQSIHNGSYATQDLMLTLNYHFGP